MISIYFNAARTSVVKFCRLLSFELIRNSNSSDQNFCSQHIYIYYNTYCGQIVQSLQYSMYLKIPIEHSIYVIPIFEHFYDIKKNNYKICIYVNAATRSYICETLSIINFIIHSSTY